MGWYGGADCGCCPECTIFIDDFNRADSTSLGSNWSEDSGSWEIASNELKCTADGKVTAVPTHPDSTSHAKVSTVFNCTETDVKVRIYVDYDGTNYHFAEVSVGSAGAGADSELKLFKHSGGSDTQLGTTRTITGVSTGEDVQFDVCFDGTILEAYISDGTNDGGATESTTEVGGDQVALECNGIVSGQVTFDPFEYFKHRDATNPSCPDCVTTEACTNCATNAPDTLAVTFASVADDVCTDCDTSANGTFLVPWLTESGNQCVWRKLYNGPGCGAEQFLTVSLALSGGNYLLDVTWGLVPPASNSFIRFQSNLGTSKPACLMWTNQDVAFHSDIWCDASGATCKVTAI